MRNNFGDNAFIYGLRFPKIVEFLLPFVNVNAQNYKGESALIVASKCGYVEVIHILLDMKQTDKTLQDEAGLSALDYASNSFTTNFKSNYIEIRGNRSQSPSPYPVATATAT